MKIKNCLTVFCTDANNPASDLFLDIAVMVMPDKFFH